MSDMKSNGIINDNLTIIGSENNLSIKNLNLGNYLEEMKWMLKEIDISKYNCDMDFWK